MTQEALEHLNEIWNEMKRENSNLRYTTVYNYIKFLGKVTHYIKIFPDSKYLMAHLNNAIPDKWRKLDIAERIMTEFLIADSEIKNLDLIMMTLNQNVPMKLEISQTTYTIEVDASLTKSTIDKSYETPVLGFSNKVNDKGAILEVGRSIMVKIGSPDLTLDLADLMEMVE